MKSIVHSVVNDLKKVDSREQQRPLNWLLASLLESLIKHHNSSFAAVTEFCMSSIFSLLDEACSLPSSCCQIVFDVLMERVHEISNNSKINMISVRMIVFPLTLSTIQNALEFPKLRWCRRNTWNWVRTRLCMSLNTSANASKRPISPLFWIVFWPVFEMFVLLYLFSVESRRSFDVSTANSRSFFALGIACSQNYWSNRIQFIASHFRTCFTPFLKCVCSSQTTRTTCSLFRVPFRFCAFVKFFYLFFILIPKNTRSAGPNLSNF